MFKILVVEDDRVIAQGIEKDLIRRGYEVFVVKDFQRVLEDFKEVSPDLVLLDLGIPFKNGFGRLSEIRRFSEVPVIFISAASEDLHIVTGMQLGADDYLVKPFSMEVLHAKVEGVLRRVYQQRFPQRFYQYGDLTLLLDEMALLYHDQKLDLTKNEFKILECLFSKSGQVVSRQNLMKNLWHSDLYIDDNTLTVNIGRLRKKLGELGLENVIQTKKGTGYYVRLEQ